MSLFKKIFGEKKTEHKEVLDILNSDSKIFRTKKGKQIFQVHPKFYKTMEKRFSSSQNKTRFQSCIKVKSALLKKINPYWKSSQITGIWHIVKNDMQTSKQILGYFIVQWCNEYKSLLDLYIQKYQKKIKGLFAQDQNPKIDFEQIDKEIIKLFHKNILILMQLLWEALYLVYQFFFKQNQKHYKQLKTKNGQQFYQQQLTKRNQQIRIIYERLMLAHLTTIKPFKQLYKSLLEYSAIRIIPQRMKKNSQKFQKFLKAKFNITEQYSQVFSQTFDQIRDYHKNPCLKEKFQYICTFYNSIDSSIRQSQQRTLPKEQIIKAQNSVPQLFTYIFRTIFPQTCISAMYIDIFFSLKNQDISWKTNYNDMERQLQIFFKQNFVDDLTNHYERLRNAYYK